MKTQRLAAIDEIILLPNSDVVLWMRDVAQINRDAKKERRWSVLYIFSLYLSRLVSLVSSSVPPRPTAAPAHEAQSHISLSV